MGKVIFGVIFLFVGILFFMSSVGDRNLNAIVGGYFLSLIFFIAGVVLLVKGIKGSNKGTTPAKEKSCRHCKMMIPRSATTCPYCKKSQGWTLAAKVGLGFIVLIVLIPMIASREKSSSKGNTPLPQQAKPVINPPDEKSIKQNREALEKLKKNFSFKKDEFKNSGWYTHKNQTVNNSWSRTCLATPVDADGYIYLTSQYYGDSWLFHSKVMVKTGSAVLEAGEVSTLSNDHHTQIGSGSVWEINHYTNNRDNGIIKLIAENYDKEIKVRFVGQQYEKDITLSKQDKVAIKESYELSELLKKTK